MRYHGLKQEAYDYIHNLLMSGHFKPGDRIREDLIAEEMGISRTPVREAVNRLVAEGFLVNVPRKGLFTAKVSKEDMLQMIEVRIALEALALESCCKNVTEEQIRKLEEIEQAYAEKMNAMDYMEASYLDEEFHTLITSVSQNKKLQQYSRDLQKYFTYSRVQSIDKMKADRMGGSVEDHDKLLQAISARDAVLAKQLITEHLRHIQRAIENRDA